MSRFLCGAALCGAMALTVAMAGQAQAQFGPNPFGPGNGSTTTVNGMGNSQGAGGQGQGGLLDLPPSVRKIVSIDAHNMLIAEVVDENGRISYVRLRNDHTYSGGLARVFGGSTMSTLPFVTPGVTSGFGGMGGAGLGGGFGGSSFGNSFGSGNPFGGSAGGGVSGFNPGNFGAGTNVTGSGIFAPPTR